MACLTHAIKQKYNLDDELVFATCHGSFLKKISLLNVPGIASGTAASESQWSFWPFRSVRHWAHPS